MADGVCKLTGSRGRFVDSHLLPKALTKAGGLGKPLMQGGKGRPPTTRHSSWYDNRLVTRAGEDILAKLDDWAIKELRKAKLVWSGWGPMTRLPDIRQIPATGWGIRELSGVDWRLLRVFMLSLLWRAGATEREEFGDIEIPSDDLNTLRRMVLERTPDPIEFYQTELTQLSTMGFEHNHTPIAMTKTIPGLDGEPEYEVPHFRFYFDGLIVHFDRRPIDEIIHRPLGELVLGYSDTLIVTTVTYQESFQRQNLELIQAEADSWMSNRANTKKSD
ncbi:MULTISPECIES: hypothetical protein [unclassified Mesorhizobium]|uniref:hypothetical protein n=1 Tax=unclassified Mesorhizobium TaxID=325217 RepID=UPI000BAFB610|nr:MULTISPECIES: hypothetical protein [unclassified Mesorhizobium]TGT60228.1 hypothetical protein EN813_027160 [Mesorhizobium sp. M00.F.Ca.ET.170.01.1.1]AZO08393.1 hypothetical protein EJ074_04065 [Mesorhizobium sp. M3A.F.Ca.ET.080.04.2.1]PBB84681.1 hypothetical protein CK216_22480 [Mesorhizobium sp. WSM3876]RWB72189.1 MAG: hypothetical protein EOQ49_13210 [Mesorhizobium sp.]RWB89409.1 MAG: hypothetical protein EOQ52_13720 [Mesorhizobium sp.]